MEVVNGSGKSVSLETTFVSHSTQNTSSIFTAQKIPRFLVSEKERNSTEGVDVEVPELSPKDMQELYDYLINITSEGLTDT